MLSYAHLSALTLGLGLLASGMYPLILYRATRGQPPTLEAVSFHAMSLLIGGTYVGLSILIHRRLAWALRAAICVSLVILTCIAAIVLVGGADSVSLFTFLLTLNTAFTSWLALTAQRAALIYARLLPRLPLPLPPLRRLSCAPKTPASSDRRRPSQPASAPAADPIGPPSKSAARASSQPATYR